MLDQVRFTCPFLSRPRANLSSNRPSSTEPTCLVHLASAVLVVRLEVNNQPKLLRVVVTVSIPVASMDLLLGAVLHNPVLATRVEAQLPLLHPMPLPLPQWRLVPVVPVSRLVVSNLRLRLPARAEAVSLVLLHLSQQQLSLKEIQLAIAQLASPTSFAMSTCHLPSSTLISW